MNLFIPLTILFPLFAGIAIFMAGSRGKSLALFGVLAAIATLFLSIGICYDTYEALGDNKFVVSTVVPAIQYAPSWMRIHLPVNMGGSSLVWQLGFGVDGIGALMVLLTGIAFAATSVFAISQIRTRCHQYIALLLITESILMGVFMAMDLVTFYVCFEGILLPSVLLITGWGNAQAVAASRKFLLFTLAGSIPMVVGLIGIALQGHNSGAPPSVEFNTLSTLAVRAQETAIQSGPAAVQELVASQQWIVWLLLLGFGIKMAVLPLHTWLPTTYAASHPNTTAIIASVVAKLGVFGVLRIVLPLTPIGLAAYAQTLFASLGAIAIVYGALVALSQSDLRKVFAYSSISHMGFVTIGLMSLNTDGIAGATIQMFNHGIVTCAMFLILGALEQRKGNINFKMEDLGLAAIFPRISVLLIFFILAGAGLPGLNGFVGEFLALVGMTRVNGVITCIAVSGTVLGAWYGLRIIQRLLFGSDAKGIEKNGVDSPVDINTSELATLALMAIVCLYIGVRPSGPMKLIESDVQRMAKITEPAAKQMLPQVDTLAQTPSN